MAKTQSTKAKSAKPVVTRKTRAKPAAPAPQIMLSDWLARDERLSHRPEMRGAFIRYCKRCGVRRASAAHFDDLLTTFERGTD